MYHLRGFAFVEGKKVVISSDKPVLESYEEAHECVKEAGFKHYLFILEKGEDENV